jgi:hypothetical protein
MRRCFHGYLSEQTPMTTLETKFEPATAQADEAVFVAHDGRRARRLRNAAIAVGVLAILWVIGLGVGMLGFGNLPGVALVKGARADSKTPAPTPSLSAKAATARSLAAEAKAVRRISARIASAHGARTATHRRAAPVSKASHRPVVTPPAAATQTPINPATRTRGWARKGYQAPRGQLRKAAPPPPPATSRGRQVGRTKLQPAPTPVVPPGQAKKAVEPPPPPPPPKKG